jgi:hypothetical protein
LPGDSLKQAVIGILTGGRTLKPYSFNQSLIFFFNLFRSLFPVFIRQFCWRTLAALFIFNMSLIRCMDIPSPPWHPAPQPKLICSDPKKPCLTLNLRVQVFYNHFILSTRSLPQMETPV